MNFSDRIKNEFVKIASYIPANVKAVAQGEIAKVNLTNPNASGVDKRGIVAAVMASLTGLEEGLWHGITHIFWLELAAKSPDILKPLIGVAEAAANQQADVIIERVAGYDYSTLGASAPVAQPVPPAPVGNVQAPTGGGASSPVGLFGSPLINLVVG